MAECEDHQGRRQEEADDYMGDLSLFLSPDDLSSTGKNPRPDPLRPSSKRPRSTLSWQERRKLDRDRRQLDEDERTRASLDAAIPPSNVGFRMLQMMGYTPGAPLAAGGRADPVGLEIRRSRAGLGRETPGEERARRGREREERLRRREDDTFGAMEEFGAWRRMQFRCRRLVADFRKAEAALAQLENRDEVEPEKDGDGEGGLEEEEEEEEAITEEELRSLLMKLRGEHRYCLYCGVQYDSAEDLEANCPGLEEEVH